ncbi:phage tail sheath family protein [Agathobaculum sp. NSJ-28]|uniref:Phage tail sheath family protein n=1 Tax=Agathobaculum faecis TaxID=2763013 RepID=A0A923RWY9_9FIRM|nr:phage tail sheath family protein [Agathobaculum faecis]MBC5726612.1 phage tail sheath family protein [Agathobaculum faecis]
MALGGGTFTIQNKILPGAYINFVSAARASATLSDRGVAAFPLQLSWGPENEVVTVGSRDFQKDSLKLFGYAYTADELRPLRELFANAQTLHVFNLNTGGKKASCKYADAKYPGKVGNNLRIVIGQGEGYEAEENEVFDVSVYLGSVLVDIQRGVKAVSELRPNDYVVWKGEEAFDVSVGITFTAGADGTAQDAAYQAFLDKIEPYSFNVMGCDTTDDTVKGLFANFVKRLRDEQGVKFQLVLFRYSKADYEGVISVKNGLAGADADPSMVYWATGAEAACAVNKSLTNVTYTGEYTPDVNLTQTQLENAIAAGEFVFHRVGSEVRVLTDINTFVSVTDEKSADFSSNQVIRVLDQIANDIAILFNTKYLGKVQNDAAGRVSLWSDIVQHHNQMQTIRAIQNFDSEQVTVQAGDLRKAVSVTDYVQPVAAMEQLYMVVTVQ